jgi:hypothetical protein
VLQIKVDNVVIHNGVLTPLNTIDDPVYDIRGYAEWAAAPGASTHSLEITVVSGKFEFTNTYSNYMRIWDVSDLTTAKSTSEYYFIPAAYTQESEHVFCRESNSNVKINNVAQVRNPVNEFERLGQWYWKLNQGDVFTSIMALSETVELDPVANAPAEFWTSEDPRNNPWDPSLSKYLIWRVNHDQQ